MSICDISPGFDNLSELLNRKKRGGESSMASKKRGFSRRAGTSIRKHSLQRMFPYIGNKRGFSSQVARRILLACLRASKIMGVSEVPITKETLEMGGCKTRYIKYLEIYKIKKGLRAVFAPDGSLTNVLEEE